MPHLYPALNSVPPCSRLYCSSLPSLMLRSFLNDSFSLTTHFIMLYATDYMLIIQKNKQCMLHSPLLFIHLFNSFIFHSKYLRIYHNYDFFLRNIYIQFHNISPVILNNSSAFYTCFITAAISFLILIQSLTWSCFLTSSIIL